MEDQNSAEEAKPLGGTRKEKQHHTQEREEEEEGRKEKRRDEEGQEFVRSRICMSQLEGVWIRIPE